MSTRTDGAPRTVAGVVAANAARDPGGIAFAEATTGRALTWADYHEQSGRVATWLAAQHPDRSRVAIRMPDGPEVHVAMLGAERAGLVGVGIGPRAGTHEVDHLVGKTAARTVLEALPTPEETATASDPHRRPIDDTELWFLNSTSGTTGLPKCVMHDQRRWFAFHELAVEAAAFGTDEVFMSLLPAPFGFGLWTAHFTPALLGAPCILLERFSPEAAVAAIARYRVTVVAAVSTQFVMMLNAPAFAEHDLSSLRVLFTGGEMVPAERALEWETRTPSKVLQFYGSNETGALSRTTVHDSQDVRLHSAGHVIDALQVRLFDPNTGADVTTTGGPGIAACRGEVNCLGYLDDDEANAALFTPDGWMRTGDLCTIDADGVLTVAGRTSDFIIRGGKNISAAQVETLVGSHPDVLLAAAVAAPDAVFGERVCVFCAVAPGTALTLDDLRTHLATQGVGKELWPEYLVLVEGDLPRSSGGKVAKGELRARARALVVGD